MHLFYFVLLFTTFYHFHQAKTEDWSHSGGHNDLDGGEEDYTDDDKGSGAQTRDQNFQIGIALPWVSTARRSVASIPKPILVPVYKTGNFICRVALAGNPKVKILGQLHYPTMKCSIPVTKAGNSSYFYQLKSFPTVPSPWGHFEVLTNPQLLILRYVLTVRQDPPYNNKDRLMPARPVLAEPRSASKKFCYSPPYIATLIDDDKTYLGVTQEVFDNGALTFYYGLVNVVNGIYFINVLTVLNTRPPPPLAKQHF